MGQSSDEEIWEYARAQSLTVVSKDADFSELSLLRGTPPKVVWLQTGNVTTKQVETLLRHHEKSIEAFLVDPTLRVLRLQ
jgi:predicted nuclease of predicted toxin-antitoxin system